MNIVVLISGNGSNLQAMIDRFQDKTDITITGVISNKADAFGLTRAKNAGIGRFVVDHKNYDSREAFDQALIETIEPLKPDYIVLAGFMRILTDGFVNHFKDCIINIHPSLLPKYKGLNTHKRVLEAGDTEHGVSVHIVTAKLDDGPILAQRKIPITTNDTETTLQEKAHQIEHQLYPEVLLYLANS